MSTHLLIDGCYHDIKGVLLPTDCCNPTQITLSFQKYINILIFFPKINKQATMYCL